MSDLNLLKPVESLIDGVKGFLGKLVGPATEEIGLIFKEKVSYWRLQNQISVLNKTKAYCEKNKISPKTINFKVMLPLLEYSGLEDDEKMQDKWATLLGNMVDSKQNIQNNIFPYLLNQMSKEEFEKVEKVYSDRRKSDHNIKAQLDEFINTHGYKMSNLLTAIAAKQAGLKQAETHPELETLDNINGLINLELELDPLKNEKEKLLKTLNQPIDFPARELQTFEVANLVRLGILKETFYSYAITAPLDIPPSYGIGEMNRVDLDIEINNNTSYILTELGKQFIMACLEHTDNETN